MKTITSLKYLPALNKKIGFRVGCILGFIIPLLYILDGIAENPLAGIVLAILPFTAIICGVTGIIAGGSYSQVETLLISKSITKNKHILQLLLGLSYILHIILILTPLMFIWWFTG